MTIKFVERDQHGKITVAWSARQTPQQEEIDSSHPDLDDLLRRPPPVTLTEIIDALLDGGQALAAIKQRIAAARAR